MNNRLLLLSLISLHGFAIASASESIDNTAASPSIIGNCSCLSSLEEKIQDGPTIVDRHRMVSGLKISELSQEAMTYQPDGLLARTYQCKRLAD